MTTIGVGRCAHLLEHHSLVGRRFAQHGVRDHHDRRVDCGDQLHDRVAVGSVVQAVLVLDDDDIVRRSTHRPPRRDPNALYRRGMPRPTRPRRRATGRTAPRQRTLRRRSVRLRAQPRMLRSRTRSVGTWTGSRRIEYVLLPVVVGGAEMAVCTTELLFQLGRCDRPAEVRQHRNGRPAQAGASVQEM